MTTPYSIIIVSYNCKDLLRRCLEHLRSLDDAENAQVIVVDNGSTDGSVQMLEREFAAATTIALPDNIGFGGANNVGLKVAKHTYRVMLNADAFPEPGALRRLIDVMESDKRNGFAGAQLRYPNGREQPSWFGPPRCEEIGAAWGALGRAIGRQIDRTKVKQSSMSTPETCRDQDEPKPLPDTDTIDHLAGSQLLMGAALAVRREVCDQTHGFDPEFFMYYEEFEWQMRAELAGWRRVFVRDASVVHDEGGSQGGESIGRVRRRLHGLSVFLNMQYGKSGLWLIHCVFRSTYLAKGVVLMLLGALSANKQKFHDGQQKIAIALTSWATDIPKAWRNGKTGQWITGSASKPTEELTT